MKTDIVITTAIPPTVRVASSFNGKLGEELIYGWVVSPEKKQLMDLDIEFTFRGLFRHKFKWMGDPESFTEYVIRINECDAPLVKLAIMKSRPYHVGGETHTLLPINNTSARRRLRIPVEEPLVWEAYLSNPPTMTAILPVWCEDALHDFMKYSKVMYARPY